MNDYKNVFNRIHNEHNTCNAKRFFVHLNKQRFF